VAQSNREFACWLGGSALVQLATFKDQWISKKDIEEKGKSILHSNSF